MAPARGTAKRDPLTRRVCGAASRHLGRGHALFLFLVLVLVASASRLDAEPPPTATCQARRAGDRVIATIELRQFLDEETRRLLQLGMKGRIRVEGAVLRKRLGLFEHTLGLATIETELTSTREPRRLLLDGRPLADSAGAVALERLAVRLSDPDAAVAPLTLRAHVQLRVVTMSSLSKVAAWATDSSEEEASSSLLTRGLLSAVVSDLTRSAKCVCLVAPP